MTGEPLEETYFKWLYAKVRPEDESVPPSYNNVCSVMHETIFDWQVPNDDNRAADGKELRFEFIEEIKLNLFDLEWFIRQDASVFEVLVALARRCDFIVEIGLGGWFTKFLENLSLIRYTDAKWTTRSRRNVQGVIDLFNDRRYSSNGSGGVFPLRQPEDNQRTVELWYQMCAYMTEYHMY